MQKREGNVAAVDIVWADYAAGFLHSFLIHCASATLSHSAYAGICGAPKRPRAVLRHADGRHLAVVSVLRRHGEGDDNVAS